MLVTANGESSDRRESDDICDVRVDCEGWAEIEPSALSEYCLRAVRRRHSAASRLVSVLFTDNAAMAALNAEFRGKDGPTNVLSFPAGETVGPGETYLGDIALGLEIADEEAAARGVSLRDHAAHLLVHGMLHLIGYDHGDDAAAAAMEGEESIILKMIGVPSPYDADEE